jgi:hypothetical protein
MSTLSADTHPKIEQIQIELLRHASPARKFEMVTQMNNTVRGFMFAGLERRNPNATPEELRHLFANLLLGEELARKVYAYSTEINHE